MSGQDPAAATPSCAAECLPVLREAYEKACGSWRAWKCTRITGVSMSDRDAAQNHEPGAFIECLRDIGRARLREVAYANDAEREKALDVLGEILDSALSYAVHLEKAESRG